MARSGRGRRRFPLGPRTWHAALLAAPLALACASSAPYTVQAAAGATALAAGASALERAAGGCWAICTNGTVCNRNTGLCEAVGGASSRCQPQCDAGEVCADDYYGVPRCVFAEGAIVTRKPGGGSPPVGVSPELGRPPPSPNERPPSLDQR